VTIITCSDIEGTCCDSCHEDYQLGWDGGGYDEMCEVYSGDKMVANVCCRKIEDAHTMLRERGVLFDE
jgi:hypothetical protein